MFVRVEIGTHQGKIRDIEEEAARAMLSDGRASKVDWSHQEQTLHVKSAAAVEAKAVVEKKQTRRKATNKAASLKAGE